MEGEDLVTGGCRLAGGGEFKVTVSWLPTGCQLVVSRGIGVLGVMQLTARGWEVSMSTQVSLL